MIFASTYNVFLTRLLTTACMLLVYTGASHASPYYYKSHLSNAIACYQIAKQPAASQQEKMTGLSQCNTAVRFDALNQKALAITYLNRGVLHKNLGHKQRAQRDFYRSLRLKGNAPALRVNIGNLAYMLGNYRQAIREYNRALTMDFNTPYVAYINSGLANERIGDYQAAINSYERALKHQPSLELAKQRIDALTQGHYLSATDASMLLVAGL